MALHVAAVGKLAAIVLVAVAAEALAGVLRAGDTVAMVLAGCDADFVGHGAGGEEDLMGQDTASSTLAGVTDISLCVSFISRPSTLMNTHVMQPMYDQPSISSSGLVVGGPWSKSVSLLPAPQFLVLSPGQGMLQSSSDSLLGGSRLPQTVGDTGELLHR